jgi:hypothetical protein
MTKPYSLAIYSLWTPDTAAGIQSSFQMLGWGLRREFAKLAHVDLRYDAHGNAPVTVQQADFTLIHNLFAQPVYDQLPEIRAATRCKTTTLIEIPYPSPLIDRCFTFLPTPWPDRSILKMPWPEVEQITLPIIRELLEPTAHIAKKPGSVLLDHPWIENGVQTDWTPRLHDWLRTRMQNTPVAQLRRERCEKEPPPEWIRSIAESGYPTYLALTADYETFIVTHPGSYEHSIVDMAARGIRVLVPTANGRPFCNQSIIDDLGLRTFTTEAELCDLLDHLPPPPSQEKITDMGAIVAKLDQYFRENL